VLDLSLSSVSTQDCGESDEQIDRIEVNTDGVPARIKLLLGLGLVGNLLDVI